MSYQNPAFFSNVTTEPASRELMQYLQRQFDQPLGQIVVTATGGPPVMRKHQTIVWQDTKLDKTYLVYYDGTSRYYWEMTGKDLY